MKKIEFTKMVGSGNDFIVIQGKPSGNLSALAKSLCNRKLGIGADGLLLLDKCKTADLRMRIINADGSEAEMCGNGARCAALFSGKNKAKLSTIAGIIDTQVCGNQVKIKMPAPKGIKLDIPLKVNGRSIKVNFINTGVPHVVVFVNGLKDINVSQIGQSIRHHAQFSPRGTNVNFVELEGDNLISIRTYERGVEDETLACGTGSVASALILALKNNLNNLVKVRTQSGEILKIYFRNELNKIRDIWLEGSAKKVYKGVYHV